MVIFVILALFLAVSDGQIVYFYKDLYLEDVLGNSLAQGVQGQSNASLVFEATQLLVRNLLDKPLGATKTAFVRLTAHICPQGPANMDQKAPQVNITSDKLLYATFRMFRNALTGMTFTFGPTLRAKAGETIGIKVANNLLQAPNETWSEAPLVGFRLPNWLGLYAHGLHVGMPPFMFCHGGLLTLLRICLNA